MPAFNFKLQFVEPIRAGTKCHTIRGERKDGRIPAKTGDDLSLFCGMRTKQCFRILPGTVPCSKVDPITMLGAGGSLRYSASLSAHIICPQLIVAGELLSTDECEQLSRCDGFPDFATMMAFWEGRLPFKGHIVHWRPR